MRVVVQRVDEQTGGPYRTWVHTHRFDEEHNGTRVTDSVEFEVIASWLTGWFVVRDLQRIFGYRREMLIRIFENQPIE